MYYLVVVLFLILCPVMSVAIEASRFHLSLTDPALIGRWWTFWTAGIRLFVAGVRQIAQPRFTAEEIFGIREANAFRLVREIGFGNLSIGTLAICSLLHKQWVIPAAIVGGIYYGLAALGHIPQKGKNAKEYTAMISDVFACLILIWFALKGFN